MNDDCLVFQSLSSGEVGEVYYGFLGFTILMSSFAIRTEPINWCYELWQNQGEILQQ